MDNTNLRATMFGMKAEIWMLYARNDCEFCRHCHRYTDADQDSEKVGTIMLCGKFGGDYCINARSDPRLCGIEANEWEPR